MAAETSGAGAGAGATAAAPITSPDPGATKWPTDCDSYEMLTKIGEGAFAEVWRANCKPLNRICAIKVLELEKVQSTLDDIHAEVATMLLCDHPNVLTCFAAFTNKEDLYVAMPYMDKGSCFRILSELRARGILAEGQGIAEEWVACIMREVLQGLQYFHEQGQIHRDIKAGNILLNSDGAVKIADFGVSGWLMVGGTREGARHTFVGTPCWMAPEVMEQSKGYDFKADMWSVGITMLELAKGFAPYAKRAPMKVLLLTLQEDPPGLKTYGDGQERKFSRAFKDAYRMCLAKKPELRPTAKKLLAHKFFDKAPTVEDMVARLMVHIPDVTDSKVTPTRHEGMGGLRMEKGSDGTVRDMSTKEEVPDANDWLYPESLIMDNKGTAPPVPTPEELEKRGTGEDDPGFDSINFGEYGSGGGEMAVPAAPDGGDALGAVVSTGFEEGAGTGSGGSVAEASSGSAAAGDAAGGGDGAAATDAAVTNGDATGSSDAAGAPA